jgi:hypothetical protein
MTLYISMWAIFLTVVIYKIQLQIRAWTNLLAGARHGALTKIYICPVSPTFASFTSFKPSLWSEDVDIFAVHFLIAANLPLGVPYSKSVSSPVND